MIIGIAPCPRIISLLPLLALLIFWSRRRTWSLSVQGLSGLPLASFLSNLNCIVIAIHLRYLFVLSIVKLPKVYDSGIPFSGCIYNVVFNGAPVPLWQSILSKDSTATCCRKPAPIPSASTISPCVTFYGFGFIKYQPRSTFSVVTQAQVALQFRTFGPDGVILMFSSLSTTDYYAIYLMGGTVVFAVSASGNVVSVQTVNQYNDGQWYQVCCRCSFVFVIAKLLHSVLRSSFASEMSI